METAIGFIIGVAVVVGLFAIIIHSERTYPGKQTPKVIAALEEAERLGATDIETDLEAVVKRWVLLRDASKRPDNYKVKAYKDRIDAQLAVLEPHNDKLWERMSKGGAWPDLGGLANL
jgi:glutathione S-transferase